MQLDFSRGTAIHRLYGHHTFAREAVKSRKDAPRFIKTICSSVKCTGQEPHWLDDMLDALLREGKVYG